MEFKEYIEKYSQRIDEVSNLFNCDDLTINFDRLVSKKKVSYELLYFNFLNKEIAGSFIFGFNFYVKELEEQEFKKILTHNSLNYKIFNAYLSLTKNQKEVKISEILQLIQDKRKDSMQVHVLIERIMSLSYYFNWSLKKVKNDFEGDYLIKIPNKFLNKLKQRFNFDIVTQIYENEDLFVFINPRGKINFVFKQINDFTKSDVKKLISPALKKIFSINSIKITK